MRGGMLHCHSFRLHIHTDMRTHTFVLLLYLAYRVGSGGSFGFLQLPFALLFHLMFFMSQYLLHRLACNGIMAGQRHSFSPGRVIGAPGAWRVSYICNDSKVLLHGGSRPCGDLGIQRGWRSLAIYHTYLYRKSSFFCMIIT
jgi:hypothetical protein